MVEDTNPSQDMVDITGHVILESISYEKDVMEIKLPDTVVSSDYGGNFVKDVCIDEGALPHRKIPEEKILEEKSSPKFGCLIIDASKDLSYGTQDDARKFVHELKLETALPVGFAPDYSKEKQYSSGEEYDHEGKSTTVHNTGDLSEKKISLEELLKLESAEEAQQTATMNSDSTENHMPPVRGKADGQVSINDFHGVEAIVPLANELVNTSISSEDSANAFPSTSSEECDAVEALDVRGLNQANPHNHFLEHWSLEEDTRKPECCTPEITDASSTEPTCIVGNTNNSFNDLVSGSDGFNEVKTSEPRANVLDSSSSEFQSPEKSNDHCESPPSTAIHDTVDEIVVATSSSLSNVHPIYVNGEIDKKDDDDEGITDEHHDFNQRDEENCISTLNDEDNTVGKSHTHPEKDSAVEQSVSDSAKVADRAGNGYPYEPGFFGPSIMSAPVSNSGHIAYSGNVSLRSDSSTTSTRSFAFPVLQREWISSPVRMAKAERRRARRRRGWRKGLLCCRF